MTQLPPHLALIKDRIERLSTHEGARKPHGATHHQWRATTPWTSEQLEAFERAHKTQLPHDFREWLTHFSSEGVGPGCGLFEPGTWSYGSSGDKSAWTRRQFPLDKPFPYEEAVPKHKGPLPGALPLSDFGCGIVAVLVTTGPQAGKIWIDRRKDSGGGLAPEDGLTFLEWIDAWLSAAEVKVDAPPPAPKPANKPARLLPIASILTDAEIDALRCVGKTNGVGLSRAKFEEGAERGLVAVPGAAEGRRRAGT